MPKIDEFGKKLMKKRPKRSKTQMLLLLGTTLFWARITFKLQQK